MDKIWYRNPSKSEVIDRCGADEKKNEWPRRTDKSRTLKKQTKKQKKLIHTVFEICHYSVNYFTFNLFYNSMEITKLGQIS